MFRETSFELANRLAVREVSPVDQCTEAFEHALLDRAVHPLKVDERNMQTPGRAGFERSRRCHVSVYSRLSERNKLMQFATVRLTR